MIALDALAKKMIVVTLDQKKKQTQQKLGCDIGGAKELGVMYFPTN